MKKKMGWWLGLCVIMLMMAMSACGTGKKASDDGSKAYENSIAKGLDAVAEDKMDKAVSYFQNALDQKAKDKKATAYLKQAQGYLDAKQQLDAGALDKAAATVEKALKVTNGAKALKSKLTALQKTITADAKESAQIKAKLDEADKQLKAKQYDKAQAALDGVKNTDWAKKPYLKELKSRFDQLSKTVTDARAEAASITASSTAAAQSDSAEAVLKKARQALMTAYPNEEVEGYGDEVIKAAVKDSGYANNNDVSRLAKSLMRLSTGAFDASDTAANAAAATSQGGEADEQSADKWRQGIVDENAGSVSATELAKVPDSVVLAAVNRSGLEGGDLSYAAQLIAEKYPDIMVAQE